MGSLFLLLTACTPPAPDSGGSGESGTAMSPWRSVAAGRLGSCGVPADGTVVCWGSEGEEDQYDTGWSAGAEAGPPVALSNVVAVSLQGLARDGGIGCALLEDGVGRCWGATATEPSMSLRHTTIQGVGNAFCGVALEGDGTYGYCRVGDTTDIRIPLPNPTRMRVEYSHACFTDREGRAVCSTVFDAGGASGGFIYTCPGGRYQVVEPIGTAACGLDLSGEITCWNLSDGLRATDIEPPTGRGPYRDICLASREWGCAIDAEGLVECFGKSERGTGPDIVPPPDDVVFSSLSCGDDHACGITDTGDVRCFGKNAHGQATPP